MAGDRPKDEFEAPELRRLPGSFPIDVSDSALQSTQQNLAQAIYARRSEYTRPKKIRVKVGTWNVGANSCARDIGAWFADGKGVDEHFARLELSAKKDLQEVAKAGKNSQATDDSDTEDVKDQEQRFATLNKKHDSTVPLGDDGEVSAQQDIDMFVMGLQEVVDISSTTEALRPYTDPGPAKKYRDALTGALPDGYMLIAEQQLMGLLVFVFVSSNLVQEVKSVSTTSVGTGLLGYMGNKGATSVHIILGESTRLVFINSHLAAGSEKNSLERRHWDAAQIVSRTKFDKIDDPSGAHNSGEVIGDEDIAFWFGDLNYRLESIPGDDVRRLLALHTSNEDDQRLPVGPSEQSRNSDDHDSRSTLSDGTNSTSNLDGQTLASSDAVNPLEIPADLDPASLQTTLDSLLPHDELGIAIKQRKAFHQGWQEGPIRFLPTYKYDVGSVARYDTSEKRRSPSWCDRILYRTRNSYAAFKQRMLEEAEKEAKDKEMQTRGLDKDDDDSVLFDYNPDEDGADEDNDNEAQLGIQSVLTREGAENDIEIESYISHQRVLSSDHKPLDAVFRITYQAVDPALKSQVHNEVTRLLDRHENEGRPTVTVVIDSTKEPSAPEGVVNFGSVKFATDSHRHVTVANTGAVPAAISLLDRPVAALGEEGPTPPWLTLNFDRAPDPTTKRKQRNAAGSSSSIGAATASTAASNNSGGSAAKRTRADSNLTDPSSGTAASAAQAKGPIYTLEPGDTTNIDLVARVNTVGLARDLNDGVIKLDDVLILRVHGGRDYFLPVQGDWMHASSELVAADEEQSAGSMTSPSKVGGLLILVRRGGGSSG